MPLHADSVVGEKNKSCAILRVETHVGNEGRASQRAVECTIRQDVSMFSAEKMSFFSMKRENIN